MRPEPENIILGDKTIKIRPLTIGQVRRVNEVISRERKQGIAESQDLLEKNIEVLQIAVSRDNPAIVVEDEEATVEELGAAMLIVLRLGGMISAQPGEAPGNQ